MSRPAEHPDSGLLLRFADGELSSRQGRRIQAHLEACWECRAGLADLERSVEECVAYRRVVLQGCLPEPPARWHDIYRQFQEAEEALAGRKWHLRLWETARAGATRPRRWAAAAALGAALWAVVDQLPRFRGRPPAPAPVHARIPAPAAPLPESRRTAPSPMTPAPVQRPRAEEATAADELRVFTVLRRLGADLGEPVEVKRSRERVLVTGVGIDPLRQHQISEALQPVPRVAVNFSDPRAVPLPPADHAAGPVSVSPEVLRVQAAVEAGLGGRAAFEEFANRMLETSEELMSRAHALRRLAERFPPETEAVLNQGERQTLHELRREHAAALARLAAELERRAAPLMRLVGTPAPPPAAAPPGGLWQAATTRLFQQARAADAALAALLGGAADNGPAEALPARVLAATAALRSTADAYLGLE